MEKFLAIAMADDPEKVFELIALVKDRWRDAIKSFKLARISTHYKQNAQYLLLMVQEMGDYVSV